MKKGKGRPSKFTEALRDRAAEAYRDGATDKEVAELCNVTERTINTWKGKHADFLHALKENKDLADGLVEASLYQRATGYSHPEEKIFYDAKAGKVVRVKTTKHYPPDTVAAIFWLKNRQADAWRSEGLLGEPIDITPNPSGKKSFRDFCVEAGYPPPYPKQEEIRTFIFTPDVARLLLGARGYGKTDYGTLMGSAYEIYLNPMETSILLVTKSPERNAAILGEVETALLKNGVELAVANSKELKVPGLIGKDGSLCALSMGAKSFRGRHPKLVIMDDPVTPEDAREAERRRAQVVYEELHKICPNIVIIGQPVHKFDLYQTLRPIIKKKMELPHGTIPELDHDLEAQRLAGVSEESIQASYFLNVKDDLKNPFDGIREIDAYPDGDSVGFIDPSFKGVDYTALSIGRGYFDGVAIHGQVWKRGWDNCLEEIAAACRAYRVKKLCFETNTLGEMPLPLLRKALRELGLNIEVIGRDSSGKKHSRILAAGNFAHLIHLARSTDKAYSEMVKRYEYDAEHDDAPDSLASLLAWIGLIKGKETGR